VRLLPDGAIDNSFAASQQLLGSIAVIVPQPDGQILIGGDYLMETAQCILRLNPDGSLDGTSTRLSTITLLSRAWLSMRMEEF